MTEIAVVGSANMDLVVKVPRIPKVGETVLGGDLARIAGGKGANQAVAASRLGRTVAFIGRLGDDENGQTLHAALTADKIDTTFLSVSKNTPSGAALISVAADGDNAIVVSPGANAQLSRNDVVRASSVLQEAAVTLVQLEVPLGAVAAVLEHAKGLVVLNPAPAPRQPLDNELLAKVDVLVPNQTELALLTGHAEGDQPIDVVVAAQLALELPCKIVVVTLGAKGALLVTDKQVKHIEAPKVTPVDSSAAGDSFCAAIADALVRQETIDAAVSWAVQVGAATTLRAGTQPSLPSPAEVKSLLTQV